MGCCFKEGERVFREKVVNDNKGVTEIEYPIIYFVHHKEPNRDRGTQDITNPRHDKPKAY